MTKKDYYDILGLTRSATEQEIKRAFRQLAMKYHPDRNKEDGAEAKFKEINEAYEVLSDAEKKAKYDQFGHAAFDQSQGFNSSSSQGGFSFSFGDFGGFGDIFESFFGNTRTKGPRRGDDYQASVWVDFLQAMKGHTIEEKFEKFVNGKRERVSTEVKIPAGIRDGQSIVLRGYGGMGANNGVNGDLYIQIRIRKHKYFERHNNDIHVQVPVSAFYILSEEQIEVPSPWGKEKIKLKNSISSGDTFTIPGKGAPIINTTKRGDLVVHIRVYVPEMSSRERQELSALTSRIKDKTLEKFLKEFN